MLSAIFCAIEENNQEGLDKLLSMANIDVNQTNKHGEGAIHVAAGLGQLDILKMLAAKGGNLGMVDYRGDSAIYWAARQGHEEIIRYLLSQGVHLNQQNKFMIFLEIAMALAIYWLCNAEHICKNILEINCFTLFLSNPVSKSGCCQVIKSSLKE